MCHRFNWEAISAIFTAIGSLATAGAFIFTFHELRLKSNDKISINIGTNYVISGESDTSYIGVSVTNIGYLPTTVKYIGFTSKRQKKKHLRFIFTPISGNYNTIIDSHSELFYLLGKTDVLKETLTKDIDEGIYNDNEYLYICVVTSMKTHYKNTKMRFKELHIQ